MFGAGGAVGEAAANALIAQGWRVTASLRTRREDAAARLAAQGAVVRHDDLEESGDWPEAAAGCEALVFTTHLGLTNFALARIRPTANQRIVAFSSNNVAIHPEAKSYAEIADAERSLRARYPGAAIIRPTLIYGDPRLPTLTRLMRMARAWPFVPMPGAGRALVQPIFHEDLGRAAAWLAGAGEGTYAIGGPDSVTMRALYRAVIRAIGSKARVVSVPTPLLRMGAPVLALLKLYSLEQTSRVDRDRLVVRQTPLPPELLAKVSLREGLARLAMALASRDGGRA